MNDPDYLHEWISRYNEGDLKGAELEEFLRILGSDPQVRSETEADKALTEFLQDKDLLEFRGIVDQAAKRKRRGFGLNCLLLAAMILLLVAIAGFWIYHHPGKTGYPACKEQSGVTPEKVPAVTDTEWTRLFRQTQGYPVFRRWEDGSKQEELAAAYRPLPFMEGMVGVVTRAGQFRLLSPESEVIRDQGDTVVFRWNPAPADKLSFEVIDNTGKPILERDDIEGCSLTISTHSWPEGLYYWKFLYRDNLAGVGKIIVHQ